MTPTRTIAGLLLAGLAGSQGLQPALASDAAVTLERDIQPVLKQYCFDCHNRDKQKGDVNLVDVASNGNLLANRAIWEKVISTMEAGEMPPEKKPQPAAEQRTLLVSFLDGQLSKLDCTTEKNPGRVTIRRLNREEYRRTVRDLLHVDFDPKDFPNDEVGYGFDNIADVLSLSPMLLEKYLDAAEQVAQMALMTGGTKREMLRWKGSEFTPDPKLSHEVTEDGTLTFFREGEASREIVFPVAGEYTLRFRAVSPLVAYEAARVSVKLGDRELGIFEIPERAKLPSGVKFHVEKAGPQKLRFAYLNNYVDLQNPDEKLRGDRNVYLRAVALECPLQVPVVSESHRFLIPTPPAPGEEKAAARKLLSPLLMRAYRRPVTPAETERVAQFVDLAMREGGGFPEGVQLAVQAILFSPQFLFRWEMDEPKKAGPIRTLTDYELASRLSYFLWSSMPDEELFSLAERGELHHEPTLKQQIVRMLKDPRAQALVANFAGQWLQLRNLSEMTPDPQTFPQWSDELRPLMKEETERFFAAMVAEDGNIADLLDANWTFLNERLARFYGIPGVSGAEFRKVMLPADSARGGVLTQASVLMATSTPTRTSPVIRGKWILEQILGTPPPAPPANVPPLSEQSGVDQTASLRERFAEHSRNAECAGCHKRMDPLGFALENFDAIGAWRETEGKFPIDPSGKMADGRAFKNARELKQLLRKGDQFLTNFTEKLMTYGLGRGLESSDRCAVKTVVQQAKASENRFSALVTAIVLSDPFGKRRATEALSQN